MKPLEGIRVVELATYVVVPVAARVMADWGAEVIKVEAPQGDLWRFDGAYRGLRADAEVNIQYAHGNSGKKMLSLDLKTEEGREAMYRLLETADVFCSNVRYAAMERMGMDYETLHKKFPRLIYMHFNGFGYEGPEAARPGFDSAAFWAMSGALNDFPERSSRPMITPPAFGDMITSNSVLSGIMAALFHRERTGEGLRLTTSLYANGIWCNFAYIIASQEGYSKMQLPRSAEDNPCPLSEIYQCKDGRWLLLAGGAQDYSRIMVALGLDEYVDDERFNTFENMYKNHKELLRILSERFLTEDCAEWEKRLLKADVVHQKLMTSREISKSEQAWANGYLTRVQFPGGIEAIEPNSPVKFFGIEQTQTQPAGYIGDNTSEILGSIGYSDEQIRDLMDKKIAFGK